MERIDPPKKSGPPDMALHPQRFSPIPSEPAPSCGQCDNRTLDIDAYPCVSCRNRLH